MSKYGLKASKEVEKMVHEQKYAGKFKVREQAVAVGLSKAQQKDEHVPDKKVG